MGTNFNPNARQVTPGAKLTNDDRPAEVQIQELLKALESCADNMKRKILLQQLYNRYKEIGKDKEADAAWDKLQQLKGK